MARNRTYVRGAAAIAQKRLTSWFQFAPTNASMAAAGGTVVFSLNAAALAMRPFTIIRTRFEYKLRSDQAAAMEEQTAAFGMAIVSDQAVAVGVTAVPTPIAEMGSDLWFLYKLIFADESALTDRTKRARGGSVDSKAMRKVDIGQDLVVVAEMDTTTGGGVILTLGGRMLIKVN